MKQHQGARLSVTCFIKTPQGFQLKIVFQHNISKTNYVGIEFFYHTSRCVIVIETFLKFERVIEVNTIW